MLVFLFAAAGRGGRFDDAHDVLGNKAPAFVSAPCWTQCAITVYVYSARGKVCVGLVL